jgi:hypothetical protein
MANGEWKRRRMANSERRQAASSERRAEKNGERRMVNREWRMEKTANGE